MSRRLGPSEPVRSKLVLEKFFNGKLKGWGIQQSRLGQLQSRFTISAHGQWDQASKTLHLQETYKFDDGHSDKLDWTIAKESSSTYVGHETRIDGEAKGLQEQSQFTWQYSRRVPDKDGQETSYEFNDTFFLIDQDSLLAKASINKLFFEVATMSVFYRRG